MGAHQVTKIDLVREDRWVGLDTACTIASRPFAACILAQPTREPVPAVQDRPAKCFGRAAQLWCRWLRRGIRLQLLWALLLLLLLLLWLSCRR